MHKNASPNRKETLKELIKSLHKSDDPEAVKDRFKKILDEDKVRYFNQSEERFFPRTKAVIGRSVQLCHPQKSIHIVNQFVEDFRNVRRDVAEFWIDLQGKFIHIRYFPVKDKNGEYIGTLEVTQNLTDIKKLEGQKRLLDDASV